MAICTYVYMTHIEQKCKFFKEHDFSIKDTFNDILSV